MTLAYQALEQLLLTLWHVLAGLSLALCPSRSLR